MSIVVANNFQLVAKIKGIQLTFFPDWSQQYYD
jgi:hypothetical protein